MQVGCKLPWDQSPWSHNQTCSTIQQYRSLFIIKDDPFNFCETIVWLIHCSPMKSSWINVIYQPLSRRYEKLYYNLIFEDLDGIYKRTGCLKPCNYLKYWIVGDRLPTSYQSDNFLFSLNSMSNDTFVETELLVYPWTSLVAEFGGSLSLFLGISFMSLWDGVHVFREGLQRICEIFFKKSVSVSSK